MLHCILWENVSVLGPWMHLNLQNKIRNFKIVCKKDMGAWINFLLFQLRTEIFQNAFSKVFLLSMTFAAVAKKLHLWLVCPDFLLYLCWITNIHFVLLFFFESRGFFLADLTCRFVLPFWNGCLIVLEQIHKINSFLDVGLVQPTRICHFDL